MRKSFFVFNLLTGVALILRAQEPPADFDKLKALVEMGAAPKASLDKAMEAALDQADDEILNRTLYGTLKFDDLTGQTVSDMIGAAERRVARADKRLAELKSLVEQGIYARNVVKPLEEDLALRNRTLELAKGRAAFVQELANMARIEQAAQSEMVVPSVKPLWERFDGKASFDARVIRGLTAAYEKKFGQRLPVSAYGNTSFHRALGFDHNGRMDVQLSPDSPEGEWLMSFLETLNVPYFAFRTAIAGSATGAHIHVGPPSLRRGAIAD